MSFEQRDENNGNNNGYRSLPGTRGDIGYDMPHYSQEQPRYPTSVDYTMPQQLQYAYSPVNLLPNGSNLMVNFAAAQPLSNYNIGAKHMVPPYGHMDGYGMDPRFYPQLQIPAIPIRSYSDSFNEHNLESPLPLQQPLQHLHLHQLQNQHQHQPQHQHQHQHQHSQHHQVAVDSVMAAPGPKRAPKAQKCHKCGRLISRDMSRHMRIHGTVSRFKCIYPRNDCSHRTGYFNRQYDFKKHLLHAHFAFHDAKVKRLNGLNEKLGYEGHCPCGREMLASDWLEHIVRKSTTGEYECPDLRGKWNMAND